MAINAANDSNTNADRSLIQTEFEQRIANINDIALKTNYNGRVLLDGTYSKKSFTIIETVQTTETIEKVAAKIISAGDYTITEDGVYSLADGYTGTVTVNAQNVKLTQETPATQLNNVSIVTRAEGNSNLWIEGLNIANTEDKSIIKFQGADNYLTVKGTNSLDNDSVRNSATIHIGNGLKIVGDGSLITKNSTFGAGIGSSGNPGGFTPEDSTAGNLTIGGYVIITATDVNHSSSALIGSGYKGTIGDILIGGNANVTATDISFGAAIGGGGHGDVGDILIGENATVNVQAYGRGAGIGSGEGASMGGNSAGDYYYSSIRNISIGNHAHVTAISNGGAGIGCGYDYSLVGDITISSSATVNAQSNRASPIGAGGIGSTVGTISNKLTTFDITLDLGIVAQVEPQAKLETSTITVDTTRTEEISGNPLRIQSGTTADDFINIFIEDMRTKALGVGKLFDADGKLINASDVSQYNALSNDSTKQAEWLATLRAAEGKTLDDVSLTTQDNAIVAIRIIDGAIDYALNQATNHGAIDNRLGYTADNIVTINENTQAAESTIRDPDIAKTMTNYAKYNLLTRIAQEMFAQANQNSNALLGLLR